MRNNVGAIIQARMNSSRLPGKVLKKIINVPMLELLINRVTNTTSVDRIIIATSDSQKDDQISSFFRGKKDINLFRGSEKNVLERFFFAAKNYKLDYILRITADNPFFDWIIADKLIEKIKKTNNDFVANNIKPSFPYGIDLEVMTFDSLAIAYENASSDYELEHVTPYIRSRPEKFKISNLLNQFDQSGFSLTVDTDKDFLKVCRLYEEHGLMVTYRDLF